jgi:hypothetical protein
MRKITSTKTIPYTIGPLMPLMAFQTLTLAIEHQMICEPAAEIVYYT